MPWFVAKPKVGDVEHFRERFCVVNVGNTSAVLIARCSAIWSTIVVKVEEIHPRSDFRCPPSAHHWIALPSLTERCHGRVLGRGINRVRNVGDVSNSETCFPVGTVNEGSPIAWVFGIFTWPSLYSHVVNVNPATTCCFPSDFVFSDLDDGVTNTGCRDTW